VARVRKDGAEVVVMPVFEAGALEDRGEQGVLAAKAEAAFSARGQAALMQ
jgi:hypothetical protein